MLLQYTLQTILILPSTAALLLAVCLLSLQLFVVPLHFLPDAVVTRLRRSRASHCNSLVSTDASLVKSYDYVIVGGVCCVCAVSLFARVVVVIQCASLSYDSILLRYSCEPY